MKFYRHRGLMSVRSALMASVCATIYSGVALAQSSAVAPQQNIASSASNPRATALSEVTVTAERRTANVQKVAVSISVRSGTELLQQGRYSLNEILENIPGVTGGESVGPTLTGTDTPGAGVTIRGLSSNLPGGGDDTSIPAATALYVDGVYGGIGSSYDIDRVEVLRGPQGTLYGRSATGGVVSTSTRDPNLSRTGGYVLGEYGDFGLRHGEFAVNVPLITDELAVRVSGNHYEREGYFDTYTAANQTNDARVKLRYRPTADLNVLLGYASEFDHTRAGGTTLYQSALDGPVQSITGPTSAVHNSYRQYWGQLNWNFDFATLTNITAFRNWHQGGANPTNGIPVVATNLIDTPMDDTITEELRLASPAGQRLSWQSGIFYYGNQLKNSSEFVYSTGSIAFNDRVNKVTRNPGVFGETTYKITPTLRFTGGLRYDYAYVQRNQLYTLDTNPLAAFSPPNPNDLISTTISGPAGGRTFRSLTFRARLEKDLGPQNMAYAMVSSAASPGDVFATAGSVNGQPAITIDNLRSETVTSYEIGSKNRFLDNRAQFNADAYYATYGGYQAPGVNTGTPIFPEFSTLISPMHLAGVEAEFQIQATANDHFAGSVAYESARFVNRSAEFAEYIANPDLADVPPVEINASYDHNFLFDNARVDFHIDTTYKSAHELSALTAAELISDAPPNEEAIVHQGGVALGNVSVHFDPQWHGVSATAWVRNVANTRYRIDGRLNDASPFSSFSSIVDYADGRTFGVQLRDDF